MERRSDYKTALLIETLIHRPFAARALAGIGVPFDVARRVLTRPDERRHRAPPPTYRRG